MLEREFQRQVMTLAKLHHWRVSHFGNTVKFVPKKSGGYQVIGDKDAKGFPDLVLVRRERLIFAELKADKGRLRPEQVVWLEALRETAAEVYVWRPIDFDKIQQTLAYK